MSRMESFRRGHETHEGGSDQFHHGARHNARTRVKALVREGRPSNIQNKQKNPANSCKFDLMRNG